MTAVMENAEGMLGAWQKIMLNSDMYAEVRKDLKGLSIEKEKPATLKMLIRSAANRKQERIIE